MVKLHQLLKQKSSKRVLTPQLFESDQAAAQIADRFIKRITGLIQELIKVGYKSPMVLCLDEVERILPLPSDEKSRFEEFNSFFGTLRTLSQDKRLLSLLVADVHPDCNRINHWDYANIPTNPVFGFFKESFVSPFLAHETQEMLLDISKSMGIEIDTKTLENIHFLSGGHPFIARQLSSLLYQKCVAKSNPSIQYQDAQKYLNNPFRYSGILKDYCSKNIWQDLEKRHFESAMSIFCVMTFSFSDTELVAEQKLIDFFKDRFTENECLDALLWLESVGLLNRDESTEINRYEIRIPLLTQWLKMQMKQEEAQQWKIN
ncbi:MAG: hypothetical protein F6J87_30305 [Spirulina sp. SIO3F2]|nr:hypothetical protein [Spirulina sp. SIO3F2]